MGFWGLISYLRSYKLFVSLNIIANIMMAIFMVVNVPLFIPLLQILFNAEYDYQRPVEPFSLDTGIDYIKYYMADWLDGIPPETAILWVCSAIVVLFFLKNFFRYMAMYFISPVRTGVVRDLRNEMYSEIIDLPLSFFSEEKKGDLISRVSSDVQEVESSILNVLETIFREPIVILGSLLFMVMISLKLTVFVFLLILFTGVVIGGISKSLKRKSFKAQNLLGQLIARLEESLGGIRIIKAFNASSFLKGRFFDENEQYRDTLTSIYRRRDLSSPLSEFLGITVVALLVWYGSGLVFNESIEAATFFAFLYAFYNVINPAKAFSSAFFNVQKGLAALDRIHFILTARDLNKVPEGDSEVSGLKDSIRFNSVDFKYPNTDTTVLQKISFELKKGKTLALVGPSGSGKTTIVDLLARFYDVSGGSIVLDNKDIRELRTDEYRHLFGIVSQEPVLFNDSVINNIRFGSTEVTEDQVKEAAKIANAHDFIEELDNGYDTIIGDRGVKLSGGQRQRLTIARAILNNPPVIILDEATSSLDSESERLVQASMERIMEDRTAVIIAHRLSTIRNVDEILFLKDGKIIQSGKHDELMSNAGDYRKMVELQTFE
ncbi:MAG: ABC transporter ATP-binding protein [Saprospiraceae bacterium]|nr:ABC transporter ATP-binding protein [Saprospiraceae bacterium]